MMRVFQDQSRIMRSSSFFSMAAMELQPISYDDLDEITEIARLALVHDKITKRLVAEKIFEEPRYRPHHALKATVDGRIVSFMTGFVGERDDAKTAWIKILATRPDYRRRGAAKSLLGRLEETFKNEGARQIRTLDCPPNYLSAGIDPRYTEAVAMFERHSYKRQDHHFDMICSLDQDLSTLEDEQGLRAQGLSVERISHKSRDALFDLLARFWPGWRYECEQAMNNDPPSVHVVLDGDRVVAFSAHEGNNKGTGWFGPMGTDPDYRGRKLGEVLLKRCLADLRDDGHREAIIPWVGPLPFYLNTVNAHVYRVFWVYVKEIVQPPL